ncbi:hypothetical protein Pint_21829 [Pistacia integerrima]|uniref:Uncharacterized protein n=1 Tax=Pistacia integerrima TaxID=434235 RepID=A0ACC0XAE2_9ROSI|nr:hypothetical protein Pint_21829 [Pistacia integerrima]
MAVHLLVLLQIILLLWPIRTSSALSCPQNCGKVKIQYPFGIGEGCYLNKGFEVTCRNSSGSPKALLSTINLELLEDTFDSSIGISPGIYMDFMIINVSIPVIPLNRGKANISESVNLSGSPFYFSSANTFIAMDCNHYANFSRPTEEFGAGCLSFCTCDPNYSEGCYDFTCSIPPNHKFYYANLSNIYSESIPRQCNSAFVVEQEWFESSYQWNRDGLKGKKHVPARLEWGEAKGTDQRSKTSLGCRGLLYCNMTSGQDCSKCPPGYEYDHRYEECSPLRSYDDMFIKNPRIKFFVIIGCSAGLGVLLLLMGIWWLYKFIRRRKEKKLKQKFFKRNGGWLLQKHLYSDEGRDIKKTKLFTSEELEKATDNFSKNRILGQGGQGTVYKGMLAGGRTVAVKKSMVVDESKLGEFINEVVILSQVNHRNVVELLGCCLETEVPLLVYEFIPNGDLFQHIHDPTLYFRFAMKENRLFEILDARVLKEAGKEEIIRVANLTKRCLKLNGKKRPTMKEVVSELSGIRGLSGDSTMQQNYEEIDFVDTNHFEIGSSIFGSSISDTASFSIKVNAL